MVAKDILRIALFVLFFVFALRSGYRIRVPGSVRINSPAETEDIKTKQLFQRLKDTRDRIKQEPNGYKNKHARKVVKDFRNGGYFSAGAVIMIIVLLLILS